MRFELSPRLFGFIVATRGALGVGMGLLLADRLPAARRRQLGLALLGFGAATTLPALRGLMASRQRDHRDFEFREGRRLFEVK
jgi:hypothetical protein